MTAIIASARVHGRNLELTDSPINLGLSENEEFEIKFNTSRFTYFYR